MKRRPTLSIGSHAVCGDSSGFGDSDASIRQEYDSPDGLAEAIGAVLERMDVRPRRRVDVHLSRPLVQIRTLRDVSPVSDRDLLDLVRFQREKFFRSTDGDVVLGAVWHRDSSGERVARAALAETTLIETVEQAIYSTGLQVGSVWVGDVWAGDAATESDPVLALITPTARRRSRRRRTLHMTGLASLAFAGWVLAGTAYVIDLVRDDREVRQELAQLDEPLARIDAIEARLSQFAPVATVFRRQGVGSAWAGPQLARLVAAIPDDAHIHRVSMERDSRVILEGHAPDAITMVDALTEWWPGRVTLEGTPVPESLRTGQGERFTVRLEPAP